jgi:hypothetical protein
MWLHMRLTHRYPRNHDGWCFRETGQAMCQFPYDRNPRSHAYIPDDVGKFHYTSVGGKGVKHRYLVSTWWYFQVGAARCLHKHHEEWRVCVCARARARVVGCVVVCGWG